MDASPFAKLPRELRDAIWDLALYQPETLTLVKLGRNKETGNCLRQTHEQGAKALLATTTACKQMRREAASRFYAVNEFHFYMGVFLGGPPYAKYYCRAIKQLGSWLKAIGTLNSRAVRRLVLACDRWEARDMLVDKGKWWVTALDCERKHLTPFLRPGSFFIRVSVSAACLDVNSKAYRWPHGQKARSLAKSFFDCAELHWSMRHITNQATTSIAINGSSHARSRKAIEAAFLDQYRKVKQHQSHSECTVAPLVPSFNRALFETLQITLRVLQHRFSKQASRKRAARVKRESTTN